MKVSKFFEKAAKPIFLDIEYPGAENLIGETVKIGAEVTTDPSEMKFVINIIEFLKSLKFLI